MSIKISIDLWGTLIKASPLFSSAKIQIVKKYFGNDLTSEYILECFNQTKKQLNNIIENTGWHPNKEIAFGLLFSKLNGNKFGDFKNLQDHFVSDYQQLAMRFPPEIYSEETLEYLLKLKKLGRLTLSSNTLLLQGSSLKMIIYKMGMRNIFSEFNFSDVLEVSKPNEHMYSKSHFHIGDNEITDGIGARLAGSTPIIINSNDKTIKDAYDIIIQGR